jgi:ABC-type transport system involved in cytochrome c biogenesis permease subunit
MTNEQLFLYIACIFYAISFVSNYLIQKKFLYSFLIFAILFGLLSHTVSLALRWNRVEHGPFINLYEILSSNLWSLIVCFFLFMLFAKQYRHAGRYLVPILALLMIWLLVTPPKDTYLPPTYNTIWLYFHVFSGKVFLALLMLATATAIYGLVPAKNIHSSFSIPQMQALSYRLLAFAFCFESLMLLFGAVWAQDAWGRYWAWDPLETWAFLTWLSLVFVLHWHSDSSPQRAYAVLVLGCFILAFLTFFGVPFVSTAPHKGMI